MNRKSSAQQLEFDYQTSLTTSDEGSLRFNRSVLDPKSGEDASSITHTFWMPSQQIPHDVFADTSRRAGRINAARVTEEEHNSLLRERAKLLDRKFSGTITKKESNRLELVRWSLDRIEDARYGLMLDQLESRVEQYEKFRSDLVNFIEQLERAKPQRRL